MDLCVYAVVGGLLMGGIGAVIGAPKGRPGWGFVAGFLFGPIGVLIAALMKPSPEVAERQLRDHLAMEARLRKELGLPGGADVQTQAAPEDPLPVEDGYGMAPEPGNQHVPLLLGFGFVAIMATLICFAGV